MLVFSLQLLQLLKFYARFEIDEESGDALTDNDMMKLHYEKIISLQVKYMRFAIFIF